LNFSFCAFYEAQQHRQANTELLSSVLKIIFVIAHTKSYTFASSFLFFSGIIRLHGGFEEERGDSESSCGH